MYSIVYSSVLLIVGSGLVWIGSEWLEDSSLNLSNYYDLPSIVRGSLVTAFGSSFPELLGILLATLLHSSLELGIGIILGSAIFNLIVIPSLSALSSDGLKFGSGSKIDKEILIYLIVLVLVFALFTSSYFISSPSSGNFESKLSVPVAIGLLVFYGFYFAYQWKIGREAETQYDSDKVQSTAKYWIQILISLFLVGVGVEFLIYSVLEFSGVVGIPELFGGIIVIAACSSLPDTLVSIKQAGTERDSTSLANVIGSNIFDLLVVLSLGVIVSGGTKIDISVFIPLTLYLIVSSSILLIMIKRNNTLSKKESYILLLDYFVFFIWILLESTGYLNLIGLR